MTIHEILNIVKMLNYFMTKSGVSTTNIPRAILNGENLDCKKHIQLHYGKYWKVHENETPHNSQKARTQGAICLGPYGNRQGGVITL